MPLWLTRSDVENLLDMPAAIEAVAVAFRLIYQGEAELPVRSNVPVAPHDGSLMSMPAYLGGELDALGAKLISFYGTNPVRYAACRLSKGMLCCSMARPAHCWR